MRLLFFTLFYELSEKLHLVINLRNNAACPNTVIHYCSSHVGSIVSWKHLKSENIINILHSINRQIGTETLKNLAVITKQINGRARI